MKREADPLAGLVTTVSRLKRQLQVLWIVSLAAMAIAGAQIYFNAQTGQSNRENAVAAKTRADVAALKADLAQKVLQGSPGAAGKLGIAGGGGGSLWRSGAPGEPGRRGEAREDS